MAATAPTRGAAPADVVRSYYEDMGRHAVDSALGKWKKLPRPEQEMRRWLEGAKKVELHEVRLAEAGADSATVWVDVTVEDAKLRRYKGTWTLVRGDGETWKLEKQSLSVELIPPR